MKKKCPLGNGSVAELVHLGEQLDDVGLYRPETTTGALLATAVLRVRNRLGQAVPLLANRAQREYERKRGQANIVLKARQMGITTWVAGRFFLKTITHPGTLTVQVAHTQQAAENIFRCVHRFASGLPAALRKGVLRTSRASSRQIVFPELDSEYRVETAGDRNAGRGATIQNLHCSEVARWPGDPGETLAGLRAALPKSGELVLESTPNGADGCFYEEWQRAAAEFVRGLAGGMVGHFFPWWWEPEYAGEPVANQQWSEEERALAARHGLNGGQIGFRRRMEMAFRGLARQEYAEDADECFLSSGACVFDLPSVDARLRQLPAEAQEGELLVWNPAVPGREYLVAVDPAGGGVEGDYSAAQVVELATGLQCAELQGKLGALELARRVAELGREYGSALLVVERNNHGSGVLAYLKSVCRYPLIFEQEAQEGWLTSSLSRPAIIGLLAAALVESPGIFQSRRLLKECRTFVRQRNGTSGAQSGAHDDCVMAMAIALGARREWMERGKTPRSRR